MQKEITYSKIASLDFYAEGPVVDAVGNVYFTTLSGGIIYKYDINGQLSEWARSVCPNGQLILANGDHLVCDSKMAAVRRYQSDGKILEDLIMGACAGIKVNVPNDIVNDKHGNIYFSDSIRHEGKLFRIGADGRQKLVADALDYPNGLAVSADNQWLYVAESFKNRIVKIDLFSGCLENWVDLPRHGSNEPEKNLPDGLTIDEEGNIWVAHYGMQCLYQISPAGIIRQTIDSTMPLTSNTVFMNRKTMIITGGFAEPGPGGVVKIEWQ